jgi:hypothetical protein
MAVAEKDVGTGVNLISIMPVRKARPSLNTVFTKYINARQHCNKIPYAEFHPHQTIDVESTDVNSFTHPC